MTVPSTLILLLQTGLVIPAALGQSVVHSTEETPFPSKAGRSLLELPVFGLNAHQYENATTNQANASITGPAASNTANSTCALPHFWHNSAQAALLNLKTRCLTLQAELVSQLHVRHA